MNPIIPPLVALLAAASAASQAQVNPVSNAQIVRMEQNADGQAQGLFHLQGPISTSTAASQQSATRAGADSYQSRALAFFADNEALLGAHADALLLHKQSTDKFGNHHLRYYRTLAGVAVRDMEVLVHLNPKGEITSVNGEIVRLSEALTAHMAEAPALLGEAEALAAVAKLRGTDSGALRLLSARQWLFNEAPHVRWHLDLNPENGIDRLSYWLNAETGELIEVQNTLRHPHHFSR